MPWYNKKRAEAAYNVLHVWSSHTVAEDVKADITVGAIGHNCGLENLYMFQNPKLNPNKDKTIIGLCNYRIADIDANIEQPFLLSDYSDKHIEEIILATKAGGIIVLPAWLDNENPQYNVKFQENVARLSKQFNVLLLVEHEASFRERIKLSSDIHVVAPRRVFQFEKMTDEYTHEYIKDLAKFAVEKVQDISSLQRISSPQRISNDFDYKVMLAMCMVLYALYRMLYKPAKRSSYKYDKNRLK